MQQVLLLMASNLDLITSALSLIGVVVETESPSAEQAALGLATLNDLLEDWAAQGIEIGQWPQTDLTATAPGGPSALGPLKANLAVYLSPHFSAPTSPILLAQASAGYSRLLRDAMSEQVQAVDMAHVPGRWWDGGVET